jgi:hypothetical protein
MIAGATLMVAAALASQQPSIVTEMFRASLFSLNLPTCTRVPSMSDSSTKNGWCERRLRAVEWQDNPDTHGQMVSGAVRNEARKKSGGRHHGASKHGHQALALIGGSHGQAIHRCSSLSDCNVADVCRFTISLVPANVVATQTARCFQ